MTADCQPPLEQEIALPKRSLAPAGATLIKWATILSILGILCGFVVPRLTDAAVENRESALKDDLRFLRTQIEVYRAQHRESPPGFAAGNTHAAPSAADFTSQMLEFTNERSQAGSGKEFPLGPYLTHLPANAINGLSSVRIIPNGTPMPAPDGTSGWLYKPQTMELIANVPGTDSRGRSFADY